jgi:DNA-binding response OmpR family regulator
MERIPGRILIVEDDPEVRELVSSVLRTEGYDVLEAGDGWRALEIVSAEQPDLAILDMMLPGVDGEGVATAMALMQGVPILLMTGRGDPATAAARMGAYGYLRKPFEISALVDAVRQGLEK